MEFSQREGRQGQGFTLPSIATMTQGMPMGSSFVQTSHVDLRDSGNWSMPSQSKHSSTVSSTTGLHLQTILNSDDSPNRFSAGSSGTPQSARLPTQLPQLQPQMKQQPVILPTLNQSFHNHNRDSADISNTSFLDSRRSSIDSRMNVNMDHLAINPASPHESTNASQTSLVCSLHQQRGMHTPMQPKVNGVGALSTVDTRRPGTSGGPVRRAPPIVADPRSRGMPDPLASTPTKGFAWAFPDHPDDDTEHFTSPESSRRGSVAASSINTMDSTVYSMWKGRSGGDSLDTHRDALQHKAVTNLQNGETASIGPGVYSRSPELRISHKLAERKRRSEMKDLFDQLQRLLANCSPSSKSSKWEVLSKAIDYITGLKTAYDNTRAEVKELRTELEHARSAVDENRLLQNEITAMYQQLLRVDPNGHHIFGPKTHVLAHQESQTPTNRLAPLQSSQPPPQSQAQWMQSAASMQGVEYGHQYEGR